MLLIVIVSVFGIVVFSLRKPLISEFQSIVYRIRYHKVISYCESIDSEDVSFRYVRKTQDNTMQLIFEVNIATSFDDVTPVVMSAKEYCIEHLNDGIWQIICSKNTSEDFPVGQPFLILTNQMGTDGEVSKEKTCLHLCNLNSSSAWKLSHLDDTQFKHVDELFLNGNFESLMPLSRWEELMICVYVQTDAYFTYEHFEQNHLSEGEWNSMRKKMSTKTYFADFDEYSIVFPFLGTRYS